MQETKIGVIMPSYLKEYEGCAKDRQYKLRRAINSFLSNTYIHKYLIVVADGCRETMKILDNEYDDYRNHILGIYIPKQPMFSAKMRQVGLDWFRYRSSYKVDLVCYLDSDDEFGIKHLENIVKNFDFSCDFCYYDDMHWDYVNRIFYKRNTSLNPGQIGTPSIIHKLHIGEWKYDGYSHEDWGFINDMLKNNLKYKKIENGEYYVKHLRGDGVDL